MLKTLTVSTKSLISFAGASRHTARSVARPRIGEFFNKHATIGSGSFQRHHILKWSPGLVSRTLSFEKQPSATPACRGLSETPTTPATSLCLLPE